MPYVEWVALLPSAAGRFFMLESAGEVVFARDGTGAITMRVTGLGPRSIAARRIP